MYKLYVKSCFAKFGIAPELFMDPRLGLQLSSDFRGALAENFVMQSLKAAGRKTYYWMPAEDSSRGEVDFVYQNDRAEVVPIEVKSARNVRARSLKKLMEEGRSPYGVRLSEQNFSKSETDFGVELRAIPLYAAFAL